MAKKRRFSRYMGRGRTIVRNIYRNVASRVRRRRRPSYRKPKKGYFTWIFVFLAAVAGFFFSPQIKKLFNK